MLHAFSKLRARSFALCTESSSAVCVCRGAFDRQSPARLARVVTALRTVGRPSATATLAERRDGDHLVVGCCLSQVHSPRVCCVPTTISGASQAGADCLTIATLQSDGYTEPALSCTASCSYTLSTLLQSIIPVRTTAKSLSPASTTATAFRDQLPAGRHSNKQA